MSGNYYFIDMCKEEVIGPNIDNNKKIKKAFTLEEVRALVEGVNTLLFVNEHDNLLKPITKGEVLTKWDKEFIHNINIDDSGSVDDYPNGYFFYVDVWDMGENIKIVVFSLQH